MMHRLKKLERIRRLATDPRLLVIVGVDNRDTTDLISVDGIDATREPLETFEAFTERLEVILIRTRRNVGPFVGFARFHDDND